MYKAKTYEQNCSYKINPLGFMDRLTEKDVQGPTMSKCFHPNGSILRSCNINQSSFPAHEKTT